MTEITQSIRALMPSNATAHELKVAQLIHQELSAPTKVDQLWSAQACPVDLLPYLAEVLSVDEWNPNWPEARKRSVIAASVQIHRTKGTVGAVKRAVGSLGMAIQISQWFEYGGDPYTFRADVNVSETGITRRELSLIQRAIENSKNVRSHLEALRVFLTTRVDIYQASASLVGALISIRPASRDLTMPAPSRLVGIGLYSSNSMTVGVAA